MTIQQNLKDLRTARGMTQEETARKVGLTRQAISSYESGRTLPDIDMLMRLAEVYGTDLDGILYGRDKEQKSVRTVKIAAIASLVLILLLILAASLLLWTSNRFFPIQQETFSEEMMPVLEMHISLSNAHAAAEGIAYWASAICFTILLVLLCYVEHPLHIKFKIGYVVILGVGLAAVTVPFGLTDPVFHFVDYRIIPTLILAWALIFLLVSIIIDWIRKRRMKNRKKREV